MLKRIRKNVNIVLFNIKSRLPKYFINSVYIGFVSNYVPVYSLFFPLIMFSEGLCVLSVLVFIHLKTSSFCFHS